MERTRVGLLAITLFIWLNGVIACPALIKDNNLPEIDNLWPAEEMVLKEVLSGKTADLKKLSGGKEKNLQIRGKFIALLLSNKLKEINIHQVCVTIKDAIIIDKVFLEGVEVPFEVRIIDCIFNEEVNIRDCHFKRNLRIVGDKSCFEKDVEFIRIKVDQNAYFNNTTFKGTVLFYDVEIDKEFGIVKTQFEKASDFKELEIGRSAYFDEAQFKGSVDFSGVKIGRSLKANAVKFYKQDKVANFNDLIVAESALFPETIFNGGVSLEWARMKHIELTDVIAKDIILYGALIEDSLTISNAEIDNLQAQKLSVKLATLQKLRVKNEVDLTGAHIERKLQVSDLRLKSLVAGHLQVKGPATFEGLNIKEEADFQNAALETLEFKKVTWPVEEVKRKLDGLTYTSLYVDKPNNFKGALSLVERSAFNPQNYIQLEDFCKRLGHQNWAAKVTLAMKDREWKQMAWYTWWLRKIFWGWPAGYGREPMRLLVASLIIILVGAALFNPKYLENNKNPLNNSPPSDPEYSGEDKKPTQGGKLRVVLLRFLISLDQFLPAVNLGLADNWKAKDTHFFVWLFFTVEQGFGWIFVSIGLAAIYTQIK